MGEIPVVDNKNYTVMGVRSIFENVLWKRTKGRYILISMTSGPDLPGD